MAEFKLIEIILYFVCVMFLVGANLFLWIYVSTLKQRVDELESYVASMSGYLANENII